MRNKLILSLSLIAAIFFVVGCNSAPAEGGDATTTEETGKVRTSGEDPETGERGE